MDKKIIKFDMILKLKNTNIINIKVVFRYTIQTLMK